MKLIKRNTRAIQFKNGSVKEAIRKRTKRAILRVMLVLRKKRRRMGDGWTAEFWESVRKAWSLLGIGVCQIGKSI